MSSCTLPRKLNVHGPQNWTAEIEYYWLRLRLSFVGASHDFDLWCMNFNRKCRLRIFVNSERALQLLQPPAGCSLPVGHDLPDHHDVGSLEKPGTGELHSYSNLPFIPLSSKCDHHDGFYLYDFGDWTGKVWRLHCISTLHNILIFWPVCEGT